MRMAFNLGLNLDCSNWVTTAHISELDAEVRKVAWWGCYTLDKYVDRIETHHPDQTNCGQLTSLPLSRLFSLGHGRPGMTRKYDISCPKPNKCQTAEFGPWIPWSASDQTLANAPIRIVSTSSYVIELLGIATEALDVVYGTQGWTMKIYLRVNALDTGMRPTANSDDPN